MKYTKTLFSTLVGAALLGGSLLPLAAAEDLSKKEPKDIHDVMEWVHKGKESMAARVRDGKGSKEDLAILIKFYKFLATQKPEKGDAASWKEKTTALLAATEQLNKGEAGAQEAYKKAVNCKACHEAHKPEEKP